MPVTSASLLLLDAFFPIRKRLHFKTSTQYQAEKYSARKDPTWKDVWPQFWLTSIIDLTVVQTGICLAYSGVLIPQLVSDPNIRGMDKGAASWIASLFVGFEIFGALGGAVMDKIGRKKTMIFAQIPMTVNWVIMYFTTQSVYPIYVARSLCGLTSGLLTAVCYVYIAEISHSHFRGILALTSSIAVSFGMLLATTVGIILDWHTACLMFGIMSLMSIAGSFALTESPYWLYCFTSQPVEETMKVVRYFNRPEWLYQEAWNQLQINEEKKQSDPGAFKELSFLDYCKQRTTYIPIALLTILFILQNCSGIYFVIFYSVNLFNMFGKDLGFGFNIDHAVMLMGVLRFITTILSAVLLKSWSKNRLMIISSIIMTVSSIVLIVFMYLCNVVTIDFESKNLEYSAKDPLVNGSLTIDELNPAYTLAGAIALLVYVAAAGMGVLIIPWTMSSELLSTAMRGFANTYTSSFGCIIMFLVVKLFPHVLDIISLPFMFSGFAFSSILLSAFIYFWIPNTFNKEFNEIALNFAKKPTR